MTTPIPTKPLRNKQRGAALIVMGLILVLGLITLFTFNLERKTPELEAERKTALALAQAKEVLLGRAAWGAVLTTMTDPHDPGSLSCPDTDNPDDGQSNTSFGVCTSLNGNSNTGRFPWRTLGASDLMDGYGERIWYVLSPNFRDQGTAVLPGTPGTISVTNGISVITGVAAVIIAPGPPLSGQSRGASNASDLAQYLESYVDASTIQNPGQSLTFNDRILYVTAADIHTVSTQRMARELVLKNLPHPYAEGISWFPTGGEWDDHWKDWLDIANYSRVDDDNATLTFTGCAASFTIRWDGSQTNISRTGRC